MSISTVLASNLSSTSGFTATCRALNMFDFRSVYESEYQLRYLARKINAVITNGEFPWSS